MALPSPLGSPVLIGGPACGVASALRHHPKTQRGEAVPHLPQPPYPSPFHRSIPEPPCPPHPLPAGSPSTIDPAPARCGSDVVIIAAILASLGAVLAAAVLSAVGYGGMHGAMLGGTRPWGPRENTPSSAPSAKRWSEGDVFKT